METKLNDKIILLQHRQCKSKSRDKCHIIKKSHITWYKKKTRHNYVVENQKVSNIFHHNVIFLSANHSSLWTHIYSIRQLFHQLFVFKWHKRDSITFRLFVSLNLIEPITLQNTVVCDHNTSCLWCFNDWHISGTAPTSTKRHEASPQPATLSLCAL